LLIKNFILGLLIEAKLWLDERLILDFEGIQLV
jgi:hypothetical protein